MSDNYSHDFDVTDRFERESNPLSILLDMVELAHRHGASGDKTKWCNVSVSGRYLSCSVFDEAARAAVMARDGAVTSENISDLLLMKQTLIETDDAKKLTECYDELKKVIGRAG